MFCIKAILHCFIFALYILSCGCDAFATHCSECPFPFKHFKGAEAYTFLSRFLSLHLPLESRNLKLLMTRIFFDISHDNYSGSHFRPCSVNIPFSTFPPFSSCSFRSRVHFREIFTELLLRLFALISFSGSFALPGSS